MTGAGGFVGAHLCALLESRGDTVRRAGREAARLESAFAGADAVVHLAARVHTMRESLPDTAALYQRDNVELTQRVADTAARAGVKALVLASSVKAVGEGGETAWTALTEPQPQDPYGRSKLVAERIALATGQARGFRTTVLRLPLVYGAGMRGNMLRLFALVRRGVPLPLGSVQNRRSIVYVGNVVSAIAGLLDRGRGQDVFFVADPQPLSTPDLITRIATALGTRPRLVPVPPVIMRLAGRGGDALSLLVPFPLTSQAVDRLLGSLTVDAQPLADLIGPPPFSTDEGLSETARWYLARGTA